MLDIIIYPVDYGYEWWLRSDGVGIARCARSARRYKEAVKDARAFLDLLGVQVDVPIQPPTETAR